MKTNNFVEFNALMSQSDTSMFDRINNFVELFPEITQQECDYIEAILRWDSDTRVAFFLAKSIFEESN